jgi:repressor LexA
MLTSRQHALLVFIDGYISKKGYAPSQEEMRAALAYTAKSNINRLLDGLEERGFIRRLPHLARAVEVIRKPMSAA